MEALQRRKGFRLLKILHRRSVRQRRRKTLLRALGVSALVLFVPLHEWCRGTSKRRGIRMSARTLLIALRPSNGLLLIHLQR